MSMIRHKLSVWSSTGVWRTRSHLCSVCLTSWTRSGDTLLRVQLTSAVRTNWLSGNYLPDQGVVSNLHVGYNSKNCTEVVRLLDGFVGLRKPERQDKGSQAEVILLHFEVQICSSSPFLLFHCVLFRQYTHTHTHTQMSTQLKNGVLKKKQYCWCLWLFAWRYFR